MLFDRLFRPSVSTLLVFGFLLVHDDFVALTWCAREKFVESESDCLRKLDDCTRLRRIGKKVPGKIVRTVESLDDPDDYSEGITTESQGHVGEKNNPETDKTKSKMSNATQHATFGGNGTITISWHTAGGIIAATMLITCCCTLFIRSKSIKVMNKWRGKKKPGKFTPIDVERGKSTKRRLSSKTLQVFGKKQPSYETVNVGTQHNLEEKELETRAATSSTGCFKCSKKKKRKKNAKSKR